MVNDDIRKEIEELHTQVAELTAERKAKEKEQAVASNRQAPTSEPASQDSDKTGSTAAEAESAKLEEADLSSQFKELIDTIDEELKEASPVTVLAVFALGVLVGRLLPR
jgi:superfamily II helicase